MTCCQVERNSVALQPTSPIMSLSLGSTVGLSAQWVMTSWALEKELDDHHLNYEIEKIDYPTGTVQVTLDANGIPCYDIKEGAAWDNIPYTPALDRLAKNCTAVCYGSLAQRNEVSRNTIYRFLDNMPEEKETLKN